MLQIGITQKEKGKQKTKNQRGSTKNLSKQMNLALKDAKSQVCRQRWLLDLHSDLGGLR